MQSASSRIWTRVAVSISYDANHYPRAPPMIMILFNPLPRDKEFILFQSELESEQDNMTEV